MSHEASSASQSGDWTFWDRFRLLYRHKLRAREMRVLACLLDHVNLDRGDGVVWPSSQAVAARLGIQPSNVRTELVSLRLRGLIRRVGTTGRTGSVVRWEVCPRPEGASTPTQDGSKGASSGVRKVRPVGRKGSIQVNAKSASEQTHGMTQERTKERPMKGTPIVCDPARKSLRPNGTPSAFRILLDQFVEAAWSDFNLARSKQPTLRDLGAISDARRTLGRKSLRCGASEPFEVARRRVRRAIAHQFTDPFLRKRRVDSWESLCRHVEAWSEKGEVLERTSYAPGDPREVGASWLAARRSARNGSAER